MKNAVIGIDIQHDFVHEDGELYVPGAEHDLERFVSWIARNSDQISKIYLSMDTHLVHQIFFSSWWVDENTIHPPFYTVITHEDIRSNRWMPLYHGSWSRTYVERLRIEAKKDLVIWPYHTMLGTLGHSIMPDLYAEVMEHSLRHHVSPGLIKKGDLWATEHYSIFEPEVKSPYGPHMNYALFHELMDYDRIFIGGQAKSHCVLESLRSIHKQDFYPDMINKVYLLEDTTSCVQVDGVSFETITYSALKALQEQGLNLIDTEYEI